MDKNLKEVNRLFEKWNDPNGGATTQELKNLKYLLRSLADTVDVVISMRQRDEEM